MLSLNDSMIKTYLRINILIQILILEIPSVPIYHLLRTYVIVDSTKDIFCLFFFIYVIIIIVLFICIITNLGCKLKHNI